MNTHSHRRRVLVWLALLASAPARAADPAVQPPPRPASAGAALRCSIRHDDTGWWFIAPEGRRFFSRGICCVTEGTPREAFDEQNPSYAAWREYATPALWADATLRRLRSWGFTTVGGWSDFDTLRGSRDQTLWLTPVLHIGSTAGAPWWDMWDERNLRRMDEVAQRQIVPLRGDPHVLGYYSDNELGWWNATLWKMTLEQPATSEQRRRLIRLLRDVYQDHWDRLQQDFEPENAESWTQLERGGTLFLKAGGDGVPVMRRFLGLLAERYYQLMRDIIRRYDPQALFLGDRYQSFYYPEVARASARYVDVASSNLNAFWSDGTFLRCYLDALHALTGKPILVSEFYLAATENRSGNRNSRGIFPTVGTQTERGRAARATLMALTRLPYVVGADWFQHADEPTHGRDDGENFNFGLVDIRDRPYAELTRMFASLAEADLKARPRARRPEAAAGVPPAPRDPFADFTPTRALQTWDRERGFVKPTTEFPFADLYVCWNRRALYLGLYAIDIVEAAYYRTAAVPKSDRPVWTVEIDGRPVVQARLGGGREALVSNPAVRVENLSGLDLDVRNIAVMELPATVIGRARLKSGDRFAARSVLVSHGHAYRIEWAGTFPLRK